MKELDLTQGSVPKVLLQFAVPFLIANVLQALYGGADLFVVGQYDDSASVAAVAIGSQVMQTITGIILGITTGTTVLIAIATGAKDDRQVASTIGSSVWLFSIIGIVLTLVMVLFHDRISSLMHTPAEAMEDTKSYILVCSVGILFIVGYNVVCGILRGLGDSKTPLYFVGLACIINIVLDFILVGAFHLGPTGAAIATVTAQGVSFTIALWFLYRRGFHFTVIVNQMGVIASASLGVVEKIIVFAMLPPMAISSAVATMTAQNYGAGLIQRMNKCLLSGIGFALIFGLSVCLYSQFLPETLTAFFTKDPAVVAMAAEYLRGYSIDCVVVSFVFCINSYFSGQGNSLFPMIHSLIATFLFRIPLSYWFSQIDSSSLFIMGFAPPISTVVSLFICIWYLRYTRKRNY